MRKEAQKRNTVEIATVQNYHNGNYHSESYITEGFQSLKYFASDRPEKLTANFERHNGLPLEGFGYEIETECWGIKRITAFAEVLKKIIFPLFPADLFKMQHDGSLGTDNAIGVECITQVMRKSFIRNHYKDFHSMYNEYFPAFGISATRSGNCGMHINISNACFGDTREKQIEAIRKLHYFINKNFEFACKLVKRDPAKTGYCGRMNYSNAQTMHIGGGDHYHCLNYSHFQTGRVELRLVGGQKDYYEFRNTSETVFFLVNRVKTIKWEELEDMTKVFKGCNQYVYKRLEDCGLTYEALHTIKENIKPEDLELHH